MLVSLIGTGFMLAILIIIFLPSSAYVCSKHYRFVVSETREIRPKLGLRDKILLGVFLLSSILGIASGFF